MSFQCPLAVLRNVQECLQESLAVSPDAWERFGNLPVDSHLRFVKRRLHHNSQFFKRRTDIDTFCHWLRRLPQLKASHSFQALHKCAQGAKILVERQPLITSKF